MAEKEARPNPVDEGKGRVDEVDQSKGIFPFGTPHPPDAEMRTPGSFGGPYEESGRGGVELTSAPVIPPPVQGPTEKLGSEPSPPEEREKPNEPPGALPPHERGSK